MRSHFYAHPIASSAHTVAGMPGIDTSFGSVSSTNGGTGSNFYVSGLRLRAAPWHAWCTLEATAAHHSSPSRCCLSLLLFLLQYASGVTFPAGTAYLKVVVGRAGRRLNATYSAGSGGGASYVVALDSNMAVLDLIAMAGGGGGGGLKVTKG